MQTKVDHSNMKLGKQPAVHDPRTLQLANYLDYATLPAAPAQCMYGQNIAPNAWGMMANDKIRDCTCAAAAHLIMEWTSTNGALFTPTDNDIITMYAAITGFDPATGANNNGSNMLNVLTYWRKAGIAGHKIAVYAALEPKNNAHIMQSVYLFGGCYIGLSLPSSSTTQAVWDVPPGGATGTGAPGSWGGHSVCVIGYDADGLTVVSWGATKKMTWAFWNTYCEESYAVISHDFVAKKVTPAGFDMAALQADLRELKKV